MSLTAGSFDASAVSKQGISSLLVGAQGSGVAAVAAGVSVIKQNGTTTTEIDNLTAHTTSAVVSGKHFASLGEGNNNFAGAFNCGLGATVSVISDTNTVNTTLNKSRLISTGAVSVTAEDDTHV